MLKLRKPLSILLIFVLLCSIVSVSFSADTIVEYVDKEWDAQQQKVIDTVKTITNYTPLNKDMTSLDSGIYVVDSDINYSKRLEIKNNASVGIILCNGFTLENNKGIKVPQNATLTFYGQDGNTSKVNVYNADGAGVGALDEQKTGRLIFKGGNIIAKGGNKDAGIGTGKNDSSGYEEITFYGGKIEATGGDMGAGIGAGRSTNIEDNLKVINIYGGEITAKGGDYGAGIGGGEDSSVKLINIYGGDVTATGGKEGAGIGSGNEEDNKATINIYGGTVNAQGGKLAAGIGGGDNGDSGLINISGGEVTAKGGEDGAGIGSGQDCDVDKINITGGKVNARGSDGAGIGAGMRSDLNSPIYIKGGIVHAKSGVVYDENEFIRLIHMVANEVPLLNILTKTAEPGAGIGCGASGSQNGTVYIQGGMVFAYGGGFGVGNDAYFSGAGIGAGMEETDFSYSDSVPGMIVDMIFDNQMGKGGEGGPVEITGGIVLAAGYSQACAIGYGHYGDELDTLSLPDNYTVYSLDTERLELINLVSTVMDFSGISEPSEALAKYEEMKEEGYITHATANKRVKECQTEGNIVLILPCWHLNRTYDVYEQTHSMHCENCKYEKLNEPHFYNENICECALFNNIVNQLTTVTFTDPISTRAYPTIVGADYTLPEGRDSEPDEIGRIKKFTGWTNGDKTYLPGEKVTVTEDMQFNYVYEYQYLVKIADDRTNGKLTADYEMAPEGTTITVTPQPQPSYRLKNIWYIRKDHGTGYLDHVEGSESYTVTLPPSQITLHAEFEQITYENHTHEDETVFSPCTDPGVLSGSGNYYLIGDTELTASSLASGTLNICLMGHKLTITDDNFTIAQGATLSVYDETGKGIVTGKTIRAEGTFNLYNGDLKGFTSGAVAVGSGGVFNVYGGGIIDNTSSAHGAGVSVASGGSLNIHGDVTIHMNSRIDSQGNTADDNVYLEQGAVVNIIGKLSEESVIGVTVADTENLPCTVTSKLNGNAVARNFLSDDDAYFMEYSSTDDTVKLSRPFVLSFDANGGTGEMPADSVKDEKYFLPGCDFTPPAGKAF